MRKINGKGFWLRFLAVLILLQLPGCGTNVKPDANAGPDQVVLVSDLVTLDGSASSDRDDDPLIYSWTISSAPATSLAVLTAATTVNPTFIPDVEGNYTIMLTVADSDWSDTDTVIVTALPVAPLADGTVPILVFHTVDTIVAWHVGGALADANTIITTEYPSLVADWNANLLDATLIYVPAIEAYQPELYQVVDWVVSAK